MRGRPSGIWNRCARRRNLLEGVFLPGGGTLRLEVNCVDVKLPEGFPDHKKRQPDFKSLPWASPHKLCLRPSPNLFASSVQL